jgi:hypothetical protein
MPAMSEFDALNTLGIHPGPAAEPIKPLDQVAKAFRSASQQVNEAIEIIQEPGMPLDMLSRWTRRAPLQALAAAFLVGVLVTRRR